MLAHRYLNDWNNRVLRGFDRYAKMSQFAGLWRSFTCGYLERPAERGVSADESADDHSRRSRPTPSNPTADAAEALHVHQRRLLEEAAGDAARAVPQSAGGGRRPLPKSTYSSPRNDWDGYATTAGNAASERIRRKARAGRSGLRWVRDRRRVKAAVQADTGGRWAVGRVAARRWNFLNQSWNCQLAPVTAPALADDPAN